MSLTPSLEQWPPTVTAGVWKALEDRTALAAIRSSLPSEQATRVRVPGFASTPQAHVDMYMSGNKSHHSVWVCYL